MSINLSFHVDIKFICWLIRGKLCTRRERKKKLVCKIQFEKSHSKRFWDYFFNCMRHIGSFIVVIWVYGWKIQWNYYYFFLIFLLIFLFLVFEVQCINISSVRMKWRSIKSLTRKLVSKNWFFCSIWALLINEF